MIAYLAGPMRGYPLYNLHGFAKGALHLRNTGFHVFSPIELDLAEHALQPHLSLEEQDFDLREAMRRDFEFITSRECEALVLLPGWRESEGAVAEAMVAQSSGRLIYEFNDEIDHIVRRTEPLKFSAKVVDPA